VRWPENPDGLIVELTVREDFGLLEYQRIARLADEADKLLEVDKPNSAQTKRITMILNELAGSLIRGAPPEAITQLPELVKKDVIDSFFAKEQVRRLEAMGRAFNLGSSSPDSNGSTEATPSDG
jgi:hypothetical protein